MDAQFKKEVLAAAIAAPSADNSQPWRFAWRSDALDLYIDPARAGGPSDARFLLSDLATGACLENILIRGRSLGHEADIDLLPGNDELWVARVRWRAAPANDTALAAAIPARHTDRRFPWRGPIRSNVRARLQAQASGFPGIALHWFESNAERRAALAAMFRAESLRFRSAMLRAELFSSIRFDRGWRAGTEEGLAPSTLAVEVPIRPLFQLLRHPAAMAAIRGIGGAALLGFRSAVVPVRLSPGLCLLSSAGTDRAAVVTAGRVLERVWLQATAEGLAVQPFAAAGVLSFGLVKLGSQFDADISRLQALMRELTPGWHGLIFLRLGRAATPARWRGGRRPPGDFEVVDEA
ncbi:MAG TPA: hypothetical protein VFL54_04920 [Gammaproteobacteria bacterium]|nr:hypothetical protein [Gammaproteobacteria bacterium]